MIAGVRRTVVDNDWGVLAVLLVFFAGAVVGSRRGFNPHPPGCAVHPPPSKGEGWGGGCSVGR